MLANLNDFTNTIGTVKSSTSVFNGLGETHMYSDTEKQALTNQRAEDDIQKQIYDVPNQRLIWQDLSSSNVEQDLSSSNVEQ